MPSKAFYTCIDWHNNCLNWTGNCKTLFLIKTICKTWLLINKYLLRPCYMQALYRSWGRKCMLGNLILFHNRTMRWFLMWGFEFWQIYPKGEVTLNKIPQLHRVGSLSSDIRIAWKWVYEHAGRKLYICCLLGFSVSSLSFLPSFFPE